MSLSTWVSGREKQHRGPVSSYLCEALFDIWQGHFCGQLVSTVMGLFFASFYLRDLSLLSYPYLKTLPSLNVIGSNTLPMVGRDLGFCQRSFLFNCKRTDSRVALRASWELLTGQFPLQENKDKIYDPLSQRFSGRVRKTSASKNPMHWRHTGMVVSWCYLYKIISGTVLVSGLAK